MGWTQEQVNLSELATLIVAREGRLDMLRALFFSSGDRDGGQVAHDGKGRPVQLTPGLFDQMFSDSSRKRLN